MRPFIISSTLFLSCWLPSQAMTLVEAQQGMLANSNQLKAQNLNVQAQQQRHQAHRWLASPRIDLEVAGVQYQKLIEPDLPPPYPDWQYELNQGGLRAQAKLVAPIYTGGKITASQEALRWSSEQAKAEQLQTQDQMTRTLIDSYFGLQLAKEAEDIYHKSYQLLQEHQHRASRFADQGMISQLQSMQAAVAADQSYVRWRQAQQQRREAEIYFSQLVGQPAQCLATPLQISAPLDKSSQQLTLTAMQQHPGLKKLHALEKISAEQINIERSQLRPQVFAFAQAELNPHMSPLSEPDWMLGLGLQVPINTGVSRRQMVQAAELQNQQVQMLQLQAQQDLIMGLEIAEHRLSHSIQVHELLQQDLLLAEENARLQQLAFAAGQATSLELSEATLQLAVTELEIAQAKFLHLQSLADLLLRLGQFEQLSDLLDNTPC